MTSEATIPASDRPSFAKVAAMHPVSNERSSTALQENVPSTSTRPEKCAQDSNDSKPAVSNGERNGSPSRRHNTAKCREIDGLSKTVREYHLTKHKDRGGDSESSGDTRDDGVAKIDSVFEDDQTHLSGSSTKPTSFDSKSVASVTTFAMDEKESLRPDDSASVQAAEEDDTFSGPASGAPNSRVGSEAGGRLYRISEQTTSPERVSVPGRSRRQEHGPNTNEAFNGATVSDDNIEGTLHGFPEEPDEKLMEAMDSPKDRLLILQLEEKIITFIKDSDEQSLELPRCNAFGRLLAHKLGDYYHLTHFVDNNVTSVRLHRTPWSRLPTTLTVLHDRNPNKTPPPTLPPMKIMRRVGQPGDKASAGGSTAASSSAPSKATSEAGGEGTGDEDRPGAGSSAGDTPAKDRLTLTREEREAKYQAARERIFRDFPESKSSDNSNSGDQSANISRSNSSNGRRKNYRQRTPHNDSFEARSQFNVYYGGVHYPSGHLPFNNMVHDSSFATQQPYMQATGSPTPGVSYPRAGQSNLVYHSPPTVNNVPQYSPGVPHNLNQGNWQTGHLQQQQQQSSPYAGYYASNQLPPVPQQSSTRSSPAMTSYALPSESQYQRSPQSWGQSQYQASFQSPAQRNPPPIHWPNVPPHTMPGAPATYPYGQLPGQSFGSNGQSNPAQQHPLPGSYVRSPFNPQTRSFVPGGGPPPRLAGNHAQPPMATSYLHSQAPPSSWINSYDRSNHAANQPGSQSHMRSSLPPVSPNPFSVQGGNQDSIAKWGTPSHLPPKPPPSEIPHELDIKNRAPNLAPQGYSNTVSSHSKSGPLVVSGSVGHQNPRGV